VSCECGIFTGLLRSGDKSGGHLAGVIELNLISLQGSRSVQIKWEAGEDLRRRGKYRDFGSPLRSIHPWSSRGE